MVLIGSGTFFRLSSFKVSMKTDALFYELFKIAPEALLELIQLRVPSPYSFESLTFKSTEKRLDGFFRSVHGQGPNIFLEIQGYPDTQIYWRLLREIAIYHEQNQDDTPWIAVVLFLEKTLDPGVPKGLESLNILRVYLPESLEAVAESVTPLVVLKPLTVADKAQLTQEAVSWKRAIEQLNCADNQKRNLLKLLIYAILEHFPELSSREVETMIQLTPLEQTRAVKEWIQQGLEQGLEQGKLIGRIQMGQKFLRRAVQSEADLQAKTLEELQQLADSLERQLQA